MPSSWIPVALTPELPPGVAIPVAAPWGDLVLWRAASGHLACWPDRCPHRGMRLSHGFVRGELLSCIYHGWRFDGAGQCRKIPAHPDLEPPAAIRVTDYPCAERDGLVWIAEAAIAAPPPAAEGLEPLRSLDVAAPEAALRAATGIAGALGETRLPGLDAPVTLAFLGMTGSTRLFALTQPGTARAAASRALEALRRRIETPAEAQA